MEERGYDAQFGVIVLQICNLWKWRRFGFIEMFPLGVCSVSNETFYSYTEATGICLNITDETEILTALVKLTKTVPERQEQIGLSSIETERCGVECRFRYNASLPPQ